MLLLIAIAALLCSSNIQVNAAVNVFYPQNIDEDSCSGDMMSWTKWYNDNNPIYSDNLDVEHLWALIILHGEEVCPQPLAFHVQSVSDLTGITSISLGWTGIEQIVLGFQSQTPGVDYQMRLCCPINSTSSTTMTTVTTTTTPRPVPSGTCGQAEIKNSFSRIFGGQHAIANSWPWQVLYEELKPCGDNQWCLGLCGGTLIDDRHVLTAAHCVGTTNPSLITITAGVHNKNSNELATRQVKKIEKIFVHPEYNAQAATNDIAILQLAEPVQFNKYVQPACLPGPEPQPDEDVILIGWGSLALGAQAYHTLKEAKLKVVGKCNNYWPQYNEEKQICVANSATGDSACQGDSGGPMLYERDGKWIVSGIASFVSARGCITDSTSQPNVYTRVSAYLPWIQTIV